MSASSSDTAQRQTNVYLPRKIQHSLCQHAMRLLSLDNDNNSNQNSTATQELVLVVAVSGGCDSMGLLHGLVRVLLQQNHKNSDDTSMSRRQDWSLTCGKHGHEDSNTTTIPCTIHVAHFDHQLRGAESDGDRRLVQHVCASYKIPLHTFYWKEDHPSGSAAATTTFSQDSARTWRRVRTSALLQELTAHGGDNTSPSRLGLILTAHHADDSMESLLLKLLRGTHITNIKGMDMLSRDEYGNWILRPLLHVRKQDIVDYLVHCNLDWREDSSNANSDKYLRNKVRHDLIPLLEEMVGGHDVLQRRADHLCRQSQEIHQDLQMRATKYLQESGSSSHFILPNSNSFNLMHKEALYSWVIGQASNNNDHHQFTYEHLERVCTQLVDVPHNLEWTMNIGDGWDLVREGNELHVVATTKNDKAKKIVKEKKSDLQLDWREVSEHDGKLRGTTIELCVTTDFYTNIGGFFASKVRQRNLPFTPPWRKGHSPTKVTQFLRSRKVSLRERRETLIVYAVGKDQSISSVAVLVPSTQKWILDVCATCHCQENGAKRILIEFPKQYRENANI